MSDPSDRQMMLDHVEIAVADALDEGASPDDIRLAVEKALYEYLAPRGDTR